MPPSAMGAAELPAVAGPAPADLDPGIPGASPSSGRAARASTEPTLTVSPRLAFERTWLGLQSPPWSIRALEAGFRPDRDNEACPRCAGSVGPGEVSQVEGVMGCAACREEALPWSRAVRLAAFSGVLREAILEAKYTRWRRLAFDLGAALGAVLAERLRAANIEPSEVALVPVPMSWRRRWSRGLDHTLEIARGVRSRTGMTIARPLGRRHRPVQASLPRSQREANARGSFRARGRARMESYPCLVVLDDVRTTGATLRAACRAVAARERRLGGRIGSEKIWIATLAVPTPPERRDGAAGGVGADPDLRGEE